MSTATATRSTNQVVALAFGAVYVLVGLLGFVLAGDGGFASSEGDLLLGIFEVNTLHNIAHLAIGAAALAASRSASLAKTANTAIGGVYLLLGVVGPFIAGSSLDILALNGPDHGLHLASAALLLLVGLTKDRA
jgi:cyanate permease